MQNSPQPTTSSAPDRLTMELARKHAENLKDTRGRLLTVTFVAMAISVIIVALMQPGAFKTVISTVISPFYFGTLIFPLLPVVSVLGSLVGLIQVCCRLNYASVVVGTPLTPESVDHYLKAVKSLQLHPFISGMHWAVTASGLQVLGLVYGILPSAPEPTVPLYASLASILVAGVLCLTQSYLVFLGPNPRKLVNTTYNVMPVPGLFALALANNLLTQALRSVSGAPAAFYSKPL